MTENQNRRVIQNYLDLSEWKSDQSDETLIGRKFVMITEKVLDEGQGDNQVDLLSKECCNMTTRWREWGIRTGKRRVTYNLEHKKECIHRKVREE